MQCINQLESSRSDLDLMTWQFVSLYILWTCLVSLVHFLYYHILYFR
jgi:hypothetical protein